MIAVSDSDNLSTLNCFELSVRGYCRAAEFVAGNKKPKGLKVNPSLINYQLPR